MEYLITVGILGLGYVYSNNGDKKTFKQSRRNKIPYSQKSSSSDFYNNNSSYNIRQNEQILANKLMDKSKYPEDTNIITSGPPYPIINNKVDFQDKDLPIEFNANSNIKEVTINDLDTLNNRQSNNLLNNKREPESGGFQGISLTGNPINPDNFSHNNINYTSMHERT